MSYIGDNPVPFFPMIVDTPNDLRALTMLDKTTPVPDPTPKQMNILQA